MRGATIIGTQFIERSPGFNPRPYARGDNAGTVVNTVMASFNPRPYARGDNNQYPFYSSNAGFQSTPLCEGRPICSCSFVFPYAVSIHAPMRGATFGMITSNPASMFQSTPLCEGRRRFNGRNKLWRKFQSTPLCEGRQLWYALDIQPPLFQSTPLCEGRQVLYN